MRIVHTDDGLQVHLGPRHGDVVIEIPDNAGAPGIWTLNDPVVNEDREYTHMLLIDEFPGRDDQCGFPLTMAQAMDIARERKGRHPG